MQNLLIYLFGHNQIPVVIVSKIRYTFGYLFVVIKKNPIDKVFIVVFSDLMQKNFEWRLATSISEYIFIEMHYVYFIWGFCVYEN